MTDSDPRIIARAAIILAGSLSAVAGFIWAIWVVRAFRRDKRRSRLGLCMRCGYDLSHSTDRCPECGEPIRVWKSTSGKK